MAKLAIKTEGLGLNQLELKLGVNRIGRDETNDFILDHPTISSQHCEMILSSDGVVLHDCCSTNGTFINGNPISEIWLETGHQVRLGDVEMVVESTDATIGIPIIEREKPAPPPVVLDDGSMLCPRHPEYIANFQCPVCHELMCSGCVRIIRIKGGKPHYLCAKCHNPCNRVTDAQPKKKKSFLGFLQDTVRLKFGGRPKD
jgi:hypothetical protein